MSRGSSITISATTTVRPDCSVGLPGEGWRIIIKKGSPDIGRTNNYDLSFILGFWSRSLIKMNLRRSAYTRVVRNCPDTCLRQGYKFEIHIFGAATQ